MKFSIYLNRCVLVMAIQNGPVEDSDQTAQMHMADLKLRWEHMSVCMFSDFVAQYIPFGG